MHLDFTISYLSAGRDLLREKMEAPSASALWANFKVMALLIIVVLQRSDGDTPQ